MVSGQFLFIFYKSFTMVVETINCFLCDKLKMCANHGALHTRNYFNHQGTKIDSQGVIIWFSGAKHVVIGSGNY
ncbi:hypothetical protein VNO77_12284 [Canavalia gladiata]|uniref:Uncharacterized protein n=1 Tax=Canavalia gladiata TaxID=3824 RepID=A0AAN9LWP0_CANGL